MSNRFSTHFKVPIPDFLTTPWQAQLQAAMQAFDNVIYRALVAANSGNWTNATNFGIGNVRVDPLLGSVWLCRVTHTSAVAPTTFATDRTNNPTYWSAFALNFNPRGPWANATTYAVYDLVYVASLGIIAQCITAHTSSAGPATITTDAANWAYWANFPQSFSANAVSYNPAGTTLVSTNVQAALTELDVARAALSASVTASLALKAPLASPAFTGNPTAPTQTLGDNSTKLATTAFVEARRPQNNEITSAMIAASAITARHQSASDLLPGTIINGTLIVSRTANAETYALKNYAGNDPSAADPVWIMFPTATGGTTAVQVIAATSFTFSSTSTAGAVANTAFNIYPCAFYNGTNAVLGAIQCKTSATPPDIFNLEAYGIANTSNDSGAGGANSAQVFYTNGALASKQYVVLGCVSYPGLVTPGTWVTGQTRVRLACHGFVLPGTMMNNKFAQFTGTASTVGGAGVFADVGLSIASYTLRDAANLVYGTASISMGSASNNNALLRALRDAALLSVGDVAGTRIRTGGGAMVPTGSSNFMGSAPLQFFDAPNDVSAHTYKIQFAPQDASTYYINRGSTDADTTGNSRGASTLMLHEIQA